MYRTRVLFTLTAIAALAGCLPDMPEGDEDEADDNTLIIEAGGAKYSPDNQVRVVNVNFYKGSFGEEKTDARNFLKYIARQQYVPDIFTVQNLKHSAEGFHDCADIVRKLSKYLEPKTVNYDFYYPSLHGGACVIYRSGRFARTDAAMGLGAWKGAGCNEKGMSSSGVRLRDTKFNNKTISVLSVHMPGDRPCTKKNAEEMRQWVNATDSDLRIIAGDFNTNDGAEWASIPDMKAVFEGSNMRVADVWGPLDWIWRKGQSAVSNVKRIEYSEAAIVNATNYSDHRGGFEDLTY
jgi:hypothetical protein